MFRRKTKAFFVLFVSVLLFTIMCAVLITQLRPVLSQMATVRATHYAEKIIHDAISADLSSADMTYRDFVNISTDASGNVNTMQLDVIKINALRTVFSENIHASLDNADTIDIYIPMGNLSGIELLSGHGPKIPIRIVSAGYAHIDIKSDFSSAGINQTKHTVFAQVSTTISVYAPFLSTQAEVSTTVPIAETIIVGNTPDTYATLSPQNK